MPAQPTGVSGNLPWTETWATLAKVNDPTKISSFLNSQTDNKFVTQVWPDGKSITWTKNGEQKTWIFNGTDWVVKPPIATSENPIVSVPDATIDKPTPIETTQMTPDQLKSKYLEISSKLPWEVTDEDRRFINWIKARMSLGETSDTIFGTGAKSSGTTTFSQELVQPWENIASSTKNADGTYTVTYKDWTTQQTSSKPSETVFPEWTPEYYAQKTAEANQARIDQLTSDYEAEKNKREKETAYLVKKYGEDIASQYETQRNEIEAQGAKRMDTLNTGLSFSGFGRSTLALDKRDEIAKNIQDTVNQAKSQADLKLAMYKAQQEGADSEALAAMQEGITKLQNGIDDANYQNQLAIIEMNQANSATSDEAMMNLLNTLSNGVEVSADADLDKSRDLGYFVDKQGKVMIDSQGRPIQFEATTSGLDPTQIAAYADAISKWVIKADDLDKTLTPAQKADIMKRVQVDNGTYISPTPVAPSGNIISIKIGNKNVKVDSVASSGLQQAMNNMPWAILGSTFRSSEEQKRLYEAYQNGTGGRAAAPWTSKHEKGMAVDLYGGKDSNGKLLPPTAEQVATMRANGWIQWGANWPIEDDLGHFEYMGTSGQSDGLPQWELADLAKYIINTQSRWAGYSDEDVKQFTKAVEEYAKAGDSETVYQLYRDRLMSNKEVWPKIYDNQELKNGLANIRTTLEQFKQSGWDTSVFTNLAEVVANKFGTTTDVQLAKANNQLWVLVADYIRAISGTAASDKEVARLMASMPQIKNANNFNTTILDTLEQTANTKMKSSIETAMWFKWKSFASKLFPEVYGTQEVAPKTPEQNMSMMPWTTPLQTGWPASASDFDLDA